MTTQEQQSDDSWPDRARSPRRDGIVHAVMIQRRGSETACGLDAETYRVISPVPRQWTRLVRRVRALPQPRCAGTAASGWPIKRRKEPNEDRHR